MSLHSWKDFYWRKTCPAHVPDKISGGEVLCDVSFEKNFCGTCRRRDSVGQAQVATEKENWNLFKIPMK